MKLTARGVSLGRREGERSGNDKVRAGDACPLTSPPCPVEQNQPHLRELRGRCVLREPVLRKSKEVTDVQEEGTVTWGTLLRRNYDVLSVKWGGLQSAEGGVRTVSLVEARAQVLRGDLGGGDDAKRDDNTPSDHTVRAQRGT